MHRKRILLTLALLLPLAVHGGSQTDPEITDPQGDVSQNAGGPGDSPATFADVDLRAAWIDEPDNQTLVFFVEKQAASQSNTQTSLTFKVAKGPDSVFNSSASGQEYTIVLSGTTIATGPATAARQEGTILVVTVPRSSIGASGGDQITDFFVSTTRSVAGCGAPPPICVTQTGTDRAPNAGFGRVYTLNRPPVVGAAVVTFGKATVSEFNATQNVTVARDSNASAVATLDANATVTWTFTLRNNGTDPDTFNLTLLSQAALAPNGIAATLDKANATLDPAATATFVVTAVLTNATAGEHAVLVGINSTNGAIAFATGRITVEQPPPPPPPPTTTTTTTTAPPPTTQGSGRDPVLGEGTFLQDAAEAMAFDEVFGDWAEVVFLALLLLILILLLFIIFVLAGGAWIAVTVTPREATVRPGQTAEFQVEVRNRRRRYHDAMAYFEDASGWKTGVLLRGDAGAAAPLTASGESKDVGLSGRDETGDRLRGTMRVQVPADVMADARDDVTLHVVPVASDGTPKARHGSKASVSVRAAAAAPAATPAGATPIRLSSVTHTPPEPEAGQQVTTRATLENDSDEETLRLRVVLQIDGKDLEAETIEVPPKSARAVLFPWTAGDGTNRVRVQVYRA